jgi:hypothetical protein
LIIIIYIDKKDETPLSTMKLGSDTLDEEQEKAEFFRVKFICIKIFFVFFFRIQNLEQTKGENKIDYSILNHQIELDLSPTRNGAGKKQKKRFTIKLIFYLSN